MVDKIVKWIQNNEKKEFFQILTQLYNAHPNIEIEGFALDDEKTLSRSFYILRIIVFFKDSFNFWSCIQIIQKLAGI